MVIFGHVVDEDHQLHPPLPLVRLVPVHHRRVARLLVEEDAQHSHVEDGQPEVDGGEVLVLLHEEIGPVADVEVGHDEGQLAQGEEEGGNAVVWEIAEVQLARPWYGLIVVPVRKYKKQIIDLIQPTCGGKVSSCRSARRR